MSEFRLPRPKKTIIKIVQAGTLGFLVEGSNSAITRDMMDCVRRSAPFEINHSWVKSTVD